MKAGENVLFRRRREEQQGVRGYDRRAPLEKKKQKKRYQKIEESVATSKAKSQELKREIEGLVSSGQDVGNLESKLREEHEKLQDQAKKIEAANGMANLGL